MRRQPLAFHGVGERLVCRYVTTEQLTEAWQPELRFLVRLRDTEDVDGFERLRRAGLTNLVALLPHGSLLAERLAPAAMGDAQGLQIDDVIALNPGRSEVQVLYRASDTHHGIFLTNRCNSYCLMCSQPPTRHEDGWLAREAIEVVRHLHHSPAVLGFTGGEPLLLGVGLRDVINTVYQLHPATRVEVLTNGRLFSDAALAKALLSDLARPISWLVPLYGHADFLHDFVVQTPGAFEETLDGLLTLQAYRQPIQLRIVLIKPVLEILPDLCAFIGRNLPFVCEVALMGCEPIGFALANRELCDLDISDWHTPLRHGVKSLVRHGLRVLLMNLPRCALPADLRRHAQRSISDWKLVYVDECAGCSEKASCSGLFAWHERGWRPAAIQPILHEVPT